MDLIKNRKKNKYYIKCIISGTKEDKIINDTDNNIAYQITTSNNQKNNKTKELKLSSFDLGDCENILKKKYDIKDIETLIILKADVKIDNLINSVQYEIYHPINKSKLNLSYCADNNIILKYPQPPLIKENELYLYEPNSDYYNDICFPSESCNRCNYKR